MYFKLVTGKTTKLPAAQIASVVMGDRTAPTKLAFTQDGDKLISDKVVAEGDHLPIVLTHKSIPDAKAVTAKFNLNLSTCPESKSSLRFRGGQKRLYLNA
jgi:hypothetical protein